MSVLDEVGSRWSVGVGRALRRWWWFPLALGVAGALAAGLAAGGVAPKATTTLLLESRAIDNMAMAREAQNALVEIRGSSVYAAAAAKLGVPVADLAARAEVVASSDSQLIMVQARGSTGAMAAETADVLAELIVADSEERLKAGVVRLNKTTSDLMATPALKDVTAERARIIRLGEGLADNESALIRESRKLTLLARAGAGANASASAPAMALLGLVGGALVGLAALGFLGGRRGPVRSIEELERLFPTVEATALEDLPDVLDSFGHRIDTVVVGAGLNERDDEFTDALCEVLRGSGRSVRLVSVGGDGDGRGGVGRGDIRVVRARAGSSALARRGDEPGVLVVYPVHLQTTEIGDLDRIASRLTDRSLFVTGVTRVEDAALTEVVEPIPTGR